MPVSPPRTLADHAARAYTARRDRARAQVAAGQVDAARANAALAPWLAVACLCGASLPELRAFLTDGEGRARGRAVAADWICPRAVWAPVLAAARDAALDRLAALQDAGSAAEPAARETAAGLVAIAAHLTFDINRAHPLPPYSPRRPGESDPARAAPQQERTEPCAAA